MLRRLVLEYCANSTLHGLRFLAEKNRHWAERVFWVVSCTVCWCGAWMLMAASIETARQNPISFVVDTAHANWDTQFPSVSVCEMDNMVRVYSVADRLFTREHDFNLDEVLKEVAYFRGISSFTAEYCFDGQLECPSDDLQTYVKLIRASCRELFHTCTWNDEPFDCCSRFLPLHTEYGMCFTANSLHTTDNGSMTPRMVSNIYTGPGSLKIQLTAPVEVHWHSSADVPFFNKLNSESVMAQPGSLRRRALAVRETVNEPEVRGVPWEQRRCLYYDEGSLVLYRHYSYSACVVECRQRAALQLCNCSSHLLPPIDGQPVCDLQGMDCMNDQYEQLTKMKDRWGAPHQEGLTCDCLSECHEPEISLVVDENMHIEDPMSHVEIVLEHLPAERFQRVVVRSRLELVVTVGGTAGLFVGASLLSAVELVYYFTLRLCCALRLKARGRKERRRRAFVAAIHGRRVRN